nr:MAG TPA: hypothetical protein [Caudoviricetes sp.]
MGVFNYQCRSLYVIFSILKNDLLIVTIIVLLV